MKRKVAVIALALLLISCASSKPVAYPHEPCTSEKECGEVSVDPLVIILWIIAGGGYSK